MVGYLASRYAFDGVAGRLVHAAPIHFLYDVPMKLLTAPNSCGVYAHACMCVCLYVALCGMASKLNGVDYESGRTRRADGTLP